MKQYIQKLKTKKLLVTLVILTLLSLILGALFLSILSKENQELVTTSIKSFFSLIKEGNINYAQTTFRSITNNMTVNLSVWLLGISIIGIPIVTGILLFKSFVVGFTFASIISNYGILGILMGSIYIIPHLLNLFLTLVLVYSSIRFSNMIFQILFRKKDYSKRIIVKRYIKLLIITTIGFILSSIIEVYIVPTILKFF